MLSEDEIRALPAEERASLVKQLNELADAESTTMPSREDEEARHRFLFVMTLASVVLIPWIVFLAITLPPSYVTSRWGLTWVGFDIGLMASLAATAWLAWRRYHALIVAALVAATLLSTDAWFDIMTSSSHADLGISIASAVLVELPLAILLFAVAYRLLQVAAQRARTIPGQTPPVSRWNTPLLGVAQR